MNTAPRRMIALALLAVLVAGCSSSKAPVGPTVTVTAPASTSSTPLTTSAPPPPVDMNKATCQNLADQRTMSRVVLNTTLVLQTPFTTLQETGQQLLNAANMSTGELNALLVAVAKPFGQMLTNVSGGAGQGPVDLSVITPATVQVTAWCKTSGFAIPTGA